VAPSVKHAFSPRVSTGRKPSNFVLQELKRMLLVSGLAFGCVQHNKEIVVAKANHMGWKKLHALA